MDLSFIKSPKEIEIEIQKQVQDGLEIVTKTMAKYVKFRDKFQTTLKEALYTLCEKPQSLVYIFPLAPGTTHVPSEFQLISEKCDWDEWLHIPEITKKCYSSGYLLLSTLHKANWNYSDRKYWISHLGIMPTSNHLTLEELTQSLDWSGMSVESKQSYLDCFHQQAEQQAKIELQRKEADKFNSDSGSSCHVM